MGLGLVLPGEGGYEGDVSSAALTSTGSSEDWSSGVEGSCSGQSSGKYAKVTLKSLLEGSTQVGNSGASQGPSESPQQQTPDSDVDCWGRAP